MPGDSLVLLDKQSEVNTEPRATHEGIEVIRAAVDITDRAGLEILFGQFDFTEIIHLAAILSTGGERDPLLAHRVNVEGSLHLLELARQQSSRRLVAGLSALKFIFPSSIAVYGIPSLAEKDAALPISEHEFLNPITMYGINKLYVEHLGRYFSAHFGELNRSLLSTTASAHAQSKSEGLLDVRCIRFPGLLSADTVPTGGTSDYGPQMLHAAAQSKRYSCFVRPSSVLPFMAMPDAVHCILSLLSAPQHALSRRVYNVASFSISAQQILDRAVQAFGAAQIDFIIEPTRQRIVDSWPALLDDSAARSDWGWKPEYGLEETFSSYLIPAIRARYERDTPQSCTTDSHACC
jgi:threonine 3-dehydrogenase